MAKETKIINKPQVSIPDTVTTTVSGDVSIDDSTPIDTAITGTPNVAVTGNVAIDDSTPIDTTVTGTVTANSTIQNATLAVTKSGTWAVDSVGGTVTTNATIQNSTLATKGKTSYSDTTSDPDYWLGLYNDNLLIKKAVEISASEIITSATFQATTVDTANGAIQITEFLDGSSNVTGRNCQVVTWTQALQDLALPGLTDIALSGLSITNDGEENDLIGNLTATGAVGAITWTIETNASSLANIRIDDQKLEVGSGDITSSPGTYVLNIKGVDSLGKTRSENFTITVETGYTSTKSIKFDAESYPYNATKSGLVAEDTIGNMTNFYSCRFNNDAGWTLSMWYKHIGDALVSADAYSRMVTFGSDGWSQNSYIEFNEGTDPQEIRLYISVQGQVIYMDWPATSFTDGDWHHVLFMYKGGTDYTSNAAAAFELWVDGSKITQSGNTIPGSPDPTNSLHIGYNSALNFMIANLSSSSSLLNNKCAMFYMDEFTFWNKYLSTSEIAEIYSSGTLVDISTLSFFSAANCGLWLKSGETANDAIDTTTTYRAYELGVNSIMDSSGNDNHCRVIVGHADGDGAVTIDSSNFAPSD